jgi:glycine/D-amino acid oxidase-like deaminating enzyme
MQADVVVIGAGALGLSTALHCAIAGRSVVVVERQTAGSQASGRAAGLFKSVQADELRTRLARRSIDRAIRFADWAGVPLNVTRSGSYLIARTGAHREYLRTEASQSSGWGVDLREASAAEVDGAVSYYVDASSTRFALWCPEDVYIEEPIDLIAAYQAAARQHGAEVLEHEAVTAITLSGGRVAGVQTAQRSIAAAAVVDAAGAWTRQVAELAGGTVAVAPVRHQLLITEPGTTSQDDPIIRVVDAAVYLRPARGGLMAGGFESGPLTFDVSAPPDQVPLDRAVLDVLASQVEREVPAARAPVAEHRGGMFTMSPDGRFVLGPVPDVPGLWVATGCNGSGFSSSLALGEELAGQIIGSADPEALAAFAPARFGRLTDNYLIENGVWQYEHYYDPNSFDRKNAQEATLCPLTSWRGSLPRSAWSPSSERRRQDARSCRTSTRSSTRSTATGPPSGRSPRASRTRRPLPFRSPMSRRATIPRP